VATVLLALLSGLGTAAPRGGLSSGLAPAVPLTPNDNGNGSNNNSGNGSFQLPGGLVTLALIGGLVFVVLFALIAGGVVALAVVTSRRLREINETLAKLSAPPKGPTPPP